MKKKIQNWLFRKALKRIAKAIVNSEAILTERYLLDHGFLKEFDEVRNEYFWREPNIKGRDTTWVKFDKRTYTVWHGPEKTFIACESSREWFEAHFLLAHPDNGRYKLSAA